MRRLSVALLGALFWVVPAGADDCDSATTQAAMNQCAADMYAEADKQLNLTYKNLMAKLEASRQEALKQAQRDWIKYRDSHCKSEAAAVQGGTLYGSVVNGCLAEETKLRLEKLKIMDQ
ncbi:MAG: lysozyme inhibitor LprI family protein [Niveispirillum sp.]|uniref:lysozyme inhibitor LprI family protein n=1 Tax=Niveispirillum sp. TaxID=1917217 RepID=UPI003BA734D7